MLFCFFSTVLSKVGPVHLEQGTFNAMTAFRTKKNVPQCGIACCPDIHTAAKFLNFLVRTDLEFTDITAKNGHDVIPGIRRFAYINAGEDKGTIVTYGQYSFYFHEITDIRNVNLNMINIYKNLFDNRNNSKFIVHDFNQTLRNFKKDLQNNENSIKEKQEQAFNIFRNLFIQYKELTPDIIEKLDLNNKINEMHQGHNEELVLKITMLEFFKQQQDMFDVWQVKKTQVQKQDFLKNNKFFQGRSENSMVIYSNMLPGYQQIALNLLDDVHVTDLEICVLNQVEAPSIARDAIFNDMWICPQTDVNVDIIKALKKKKNLKSIYYNGHALNMTDLQEIVINNVSLSCMTGIQFAQYEKKELEQLNEKVATMQSTKGLPVKFYEIDTKHIFLFPFKTTLTIPIKHQNLAYFTDFIHESHIYCGIQSIALDGQSQKFDYNKELANLILSINKLGNRQELYLQSMILSFENFIKITNQTRLENIKLVNIQPQTEADRQAFKNWGYHRCLHYVDQNNLLSLT